MNHTPGFKKVKFFVIEKNFIVWFLRVLKEDGMYAFFMEAAAIEYHVERKCDLKQLGGLLDSKGYGIALPKGI